jgi:diadenosine tetraphosphate (Ap4A) HIT family hydrolase
MKIYETENFEVITHEKPFVSRKEGGHIKIVAKGDYTDLTQLPPNIAVEYIWLVELVGEAFPLAMNNRGVPVIWVNYHTMGNWAFKKNTKPHFHTQIFGRVKNAKKQVWPEAVYLPARESGFYDDFVPVNEEDVAEIRKQIEIVSENEKYRNSW